MSDDIVERLRVLLRCRCEPDAACCEACSAVDAIADELDRLRARLAGAERDAARYRWLRAGKHPTHSFTRSVLNDTPEDIDAAIDAAMQEPPR